MKGFFIKRIKQEIEQDMHQTNWLDEELESNGVDLEEWAFWQGYYQDA